MDRVRISRELTRGCCLGLLLTAVCMVACVRRERAHLARLYQKAQLLEHQDDLAQALALSDQGLNRALKERDTAYYWRFRLLKADVLLVQGKFPAASKLVEGTIPKISGAGELQASQWMYRGVIEFSSGDFQKSLLSYDHAAQLARAAGLESLLAEIDLRRGSSLLRLGHADAAKAAFRSGLDRARQQQNALFQAYALADLALLRLSDARYDEAIDRFQQALVFFKKIPSRRSIARTLNNLGYCELQLGDPEKAISLFQEASQHAHATSMWRDQQVSLGRMGDCYHAMGNLQQALAYYQQALQIAARIHSRYWKANWLYDLAETSLDLGDLQKAEDYNNQALALQQTMSNPLERLYPLLNAARIAASRKQFAQAERQYRSVVAAARAQSGLRDPGITLEARSGLARLLAETGHPAGAEAQWKQALALINTTRSELTGDEHRLTYLSSLINFYKDYVEFLADRGRNAEAFRVAESSRARLLAEKLDGNNRLPRPATVAQLQRLARLSSTVFLSYWLAPRKSYLWVVGQRGLATFTLPGEAQIRQQVRAYRSGIDRLDDPLASQNPAGRALYEALLAPARTLIPPGSKVAIAPDGALYNLNFDTIPVPDPKPHYWIEDVTITVVPSMSTLIGRTLPRKPQPPSLLLIGDPVSADAGDFPRLLNAHSEIETIQQQFPAGRKIVLTGASAQPEAYAAAHPERFAYIHFAAHATANPLDPLDSAIILSPHGDNFKLYARDVTHLPIHAGLVTLSACRSAGARAYAGEGLVGFAWAFLRAGARDVIAGLWEVDDRSTEQLMTGLYAGLRNDSGPAAALRAAQLGLVKSGNVYRKPYYWAAFEVFADVLPAPAVPR